MYRLHLIRWHRDRSFSVDFRARLRFPRAEGEPPRRLCVCGVSPIPLSRRSLRLARPSTKIHQSSYTKSPNEFFLTRSDFFGSVILFRVLTSPHDSSREKHDLSCCQRRTRPEKSGWSIVRTSHISISLLQLLSLK